MGRFHDYDPSFSVDGSIKSSIFQYIVHFPVSAWKERVTVYEDRKYHQSQIHACLCIWVSTQQGKCLIQTVNKQFECHGLLECLNKITVA